MPQVTVEAAPLGSARGSEPPGSSSFRSGASPPPLRPGVLGKHACWKLYIVQEFCELVRRPRAEAHLCGSRWYQSLLSTGGHTGGTGGRREGAGAVGAAP
jgi:hypothetical protein